MFQLLQKIVVFIFIILEQRKKTDYNGNTTIEENVPIEKHFDFRLNGSIDNEIIILLIEICLIRLLCLEMK